MLNFPRCRRRRRASKCERDFPGKLEKRKENKWENDWREQVQVEGKIIEKLFIRFFFIKTIKKMINDFVIFLVSFY